MVFRIDKDGYFAKRRFGSEDEARAEAARFIGGRCAARRRADGGLTVYRIDEMRAPQLELTVRQADALEARA